MLSFVRTFLLIAATGVVPAIAADPNKPPEPPSTMMLIPGKVLLSDDLSGPLAKEWKVGKGKWDVSDGVIRGAELPADMHGAVVRRNLDMKDVVIAYSFRVDGSKQTTLSLNGAKGHVGRVLVKPTGLTVQKDDQDGKNGPDKGEPLGTVNVPVKAGEWHTLVVELRGPDILATLDGKHTAYGTHAAIDQPKTNFGLTVAGESVSFKTVRVWESGGTRKDWDSTKSKLLDAMKAKP